MFAESSGAIQKLRLGTPVVPKEADLHGAAQAIIRLQDVYELDMAEVAAGKIGATESGARLSAKDCLFIGKHCFNGGVLSRSIEWFEEAWMLAGEERNQSVSQDQVQQVKRRSIVRRKVEIIYQLGRGREGGENDTYSQDCHMSEFKTSKT